MSCMICLNNLKLNMKTYISYIIYMYIYETKNYFTTTEGIFKVKNNNHKNSFKYCVDEKATELSNTLGI